MIRKEICHNQSVSKNAWTPRDPIHQGGARKTLANPHRPLPPDVGDMEMSLLPSITTALLSLPLLVSLLLLPLRLSFLQLLAHLLDRLFLPLILFLHFLHLLLHPLRLVLLFSQHNNR